MGEAENQVNNLEHKEEKKINQNSKKKKELKIKKIRNLWDNFKYIPTFES